ncbi:MAG: hypothetical protein JNM76_10085 [Betaproteobacteria bacterium]|nr:hypothetical protein [Betaproteobacteria bacterium]
MTTRRLLLVDLENVHRIDLSLLDESYEAIVYVGAKQNPPRIARQAATEHRFRRVEFQKIEGGGKNALDFHIACQLGRTFETARDTDCIVLSKDAGFDPLLAYLNKQGLSCRRIANMEELIADAGELSPELDPALTVCPRCKKAKTIEHHGGRWCTNCGSFASPPDPALLPSNQLSRRAEPRNVFADLIGRETNRQSQTMCDWCYQPMEMLSGIYDDGEWMCGGCIAGYTS